MATGCFRSISYVPNNHKAKRFDGGNGLEMFPIYIFPIGTFSCSPFLLYGSALRCYCPKGQGRVGTTQNTKSTGRRKETPPPEWWVA